MCLVSGVHEIWTRKFDLVFHPKYAKKIKHCALSRKNFEIKTLYEPFIEIVEFLAYFQYVT